MNINVQQNFDSQLELGKGTEHIEEVEYQADEKVKQLKKNPEEISAGIVNWIKEKLGLNKEDDNKESVETVKKNEEQERNVIDNQGGGKLDYKKEIQQ